MVVEKVAVTEEARPTRAAAFEKWLVRVLLIIGGLAGGVAAAIALPYTAREKRNVVVDILSEKLPRRVKGFFDAFTFSLRVGAVGLLVYAAFKEAFYAASFNETTLVATLPTSPVKFIWSIGLFLLLLVMIREVVVGLGPVIAAACVGKRHQFGANHP